MATIQLVQTETVSHGKSLSLIGYVRARLSKLPPTPTEIVGATEVTTSTSPPEDATTQQVDNSVAPITDNDVARGRLLVKPTLFSFQQIHAAPYMVADDVLSPVWERSIRTQLRGILKHEITSGTCTQEFMLAGRRQDMLKPTVVVTCGDLNTLKRVKKVFKKQKWLQDVLKSNEILFVAVVEQIHLSSGVSQRSKIIIGATVGAGVPTIALILLVIWFFVRRRKSYLAHPMETPEIQQRYHGAYSTERTSQLDDATGMRQKGGSPSDLKDLLGAPARYSMPRPPVELSNTRSSQLFSEQHIQQQNTAKPVFACTLGLSKSARSLCGLQLHISSATQTEERVCTLGGLVTIKGVTYGLTVGHAFVDHKAIVSPLTRLQNDRVATQPFWYGMDEQGNANWDIETDTDLHESTNILNIDQDDRATETNVTAPPAVGNHLTDNEETYSVSIVQTDTKSDSDWALITLPTQSKVLPNLLNYGNDHVDVPIIEIADGVQYGQAFVLLQNRSIRGILCQSTSAMQVNGSDYSVRLVVTDEVLPLGCSGSWVICGGKFCGHIIAVRRDVPWAYIVPANDTIHAIGNYLGTSDIRLPTSTDLKNTSTLSPSSTDVGGGFHSGPLGVLDLHPNNPFYRSSIGQHN